MRCYTSFCPQFFADSANSDSKFTLMNKKTWFRFAALALLICANTWSSKGSVTGQWDFNSDLSATIGQPITYLESETSTQTRFGTAASFGIPNIGGSETRVMQFPKTGPTDGYVVPTGAQANGNGALVNQFTVIMDVYFPTNSSGKTRALLQTDLLGDADFKIGDNNGLGTANSFDGEITPNAWHRIAYGVDLAGESSNYRQIH